MKGLPFEGTACGRDLGGTISLHIDIALLLAHNFTGLFPSLQYGIVA